MCDTEAVLSSLVKFRVLADFQFHNLVGSMLEFVHQ